MKAFPVQVKVKKTTLFSCFEKEVEQESAVCLNENGEIQLRNRFDFIHFDEAGESSEENAFISLEKIFEKVTGTGAPIELTTTGLLSASKNGAKLTYQEYIAAEQNTVQTITLTVNPNKMAVLVCYVAKETRDFLVFEKGKKYTVSHWMERPVVLHTHELSYAFCIDEGSFYVLYDIEIGGSVVEKNELSLQISPLCE